MSQRLSRHLWDFTLSLFKVLRRFKWTPLNAWMSLLCESKWALGACMESCNHFYSLAPYITLGLTYQLFLSRRRICISGGPRATGNQSLSPVSSLYTCIWVVSLILSITECQFLELGSWMKVGTVLTFFPNPENICETNLSIHHMEKDTFPLTQLWLSRLCKSEFEPKLACLLWEVQSPETPLMCLIWFSILWVGCDL